MFMKGMNWLILQHPMETVNNADIESVQKSTRSPSIAGRRYEFAVHISRMNRKHERSKF